MTGNLFDSLNKPRTISNRYSISKARLLQNRSERLTTRSNSLTSLTNSSAPTTNRSDLSRDIQDQWYTQVTNKHRPHTLRRRHLTTASITTRKISDSNRFRHQSSRRSVLHSNSAPRRKSLTKTRPVLPGTSTYRENISKNTSLERITDRSFRRRSFPPNTTSNNRNLKTHYSANRLYRLSQNSGWPNKFSADSLHHNHSRIQYRTSHKSKYVYKIHNKQENVENFHLGVV